MKTCKYCGAEFEGKFCPECGEKWQDKKTCPNCGYDVKYNVRFCNECGYSFENKTTYSQRKSEPQSAKQSVSDNENKRISEKTLNGLKCPECGSSDLFILSDKFCVCRHCGTKSELPKDESHTMVVNEVHVHSDPSGQMPITYHAIEEKLRPDDFLRNVAIELSSRDDTPLDVLDSEFGIISHNYRHIAAITADANVSYSATIGYDKKETYQEYENGEFVNKTRTVTDWKPFSGTKNDTVTVFIDITRDGSRKDENFARIYETIPQSRWVRAADADFKTETPLTPSDEEIGSCEMQAVEEVGMKCKGSLPGDRNRDFSSSGTAKARAIDCMVLPELRMEYEYEGGKFSVSSYADGESPIQTLEYKSIAKENEKWVSKKTLVYNIISLTCALISIMFSIFLQNPVVMSVGLGLSISSFVLFAVMWAVTESKLKKNNRYLKAVKLNDFLKEHNLKPLSDKELMHVAGEAI